VLSVDKLKQRFYADVRSPFDRFSDKAREMVSEDSIVLHGGCGADSSIGFRQAARATVGIDLDEWIARNTDLDLALMGSLCHLPLPDECIDLVAARWVLEHMSSPGLFFHEVVRVLRPGGLLLLLTTNRRHYFALAVRVTPLRIQRWFIQRVHGGNADDVFPTFYRANTVPRLRILAAEAGLTEERLVTLEGSPSILKFNPFAYLVGVAYERTVNRFELLRGVRGSILVVFRRQE